MSVHVVKNVTEAQTIPEPPDGHRFPYEMIYHSGNTRAWADSVEELIELLHDGYITLTPEGRLKVRYRIAVDAQTICQAEMLASAEEQPDDAARTVLLSSVTNRVYPPVWDSPVPLVALDVQCVPFVDNPRPEPSGQGEVYWVDVYDEDEFLPSLARLGWIGLGMLNN